LNYNNNKNVLPFTIRNNKTFHSKVALTIRSRHCLSIIAHLFSFSSALQSGRDVSWKYKQPKIQKLKASSNGNTSNNVATSNLAFLECKLQFSNSFKRHSLIDLLPGLRKWNSGNWR